MTFHAYQKKPVQILACQFNGTETHQAEIVEYIKQSGQDAASAEDHTGRFIFIQTLEGVVKAQPGDFIIRGVEGEFYPCKPQIFEKTYSKV